MTSSEREPRFFVASPEEIRSGKVTDVYFLRGKAALESQGENPEVAAEIRAASLPERWRWAVFAGLEEALAILEGHHVTVEALPEGSVFRAEEPVLTLTGRYLEFGVLETALLGVLCQASGVATRAARCAFAADGKPVYSFGARRMHPSIAPMIERAAYIGGCAGVAAVASADMLGLQPVGTMAHATILILGEERAWRAFDETMEEDVPRVALVDTFQDEKFGAIAAAEVLGDRLAAVRLDTPGSRRGDFAAILREVRWELDVRGFGHVKIFVSGGLDETEVRALNQLVDAFGIGTWISSGPVVDFSLDVVEVDGAPKAKRGKLSGRKRLWRCDACGERGVVASDREIAVCPRCRRAVTFPAMTWLRSGSMEGDLPTIDGVRALALDEVRAAQATLRREGLEEREGEEALRWNTRRT
jgi:nicotinate phosphoribosyltransferase